MTHVSRPLIGLLAAAVVFFGVWTVALKKSSSSSGGANNPTSGVYQSAISKAHQAVATANGASHAHGGTVPTTPARTTPAGTTPASTTPAGTTPTATTPTTSHPAPKTAAKSAAKPVSATATVTKPATRAVSPAKERVIRTQAAIKKQKVVALLFYNPKGADDQAVKAELAAIPTNGAKLFKLEVPLSEAGAYPFITKNVQLNTSPTLVLVDRSKQATTIVGFTDAYEIAARVADALAVPAK
jgi:hypothetical protein